jgi:putative phage-type endonuclease
MGIPKLEAMNWVHHKSREEWLSERERGIGASESAAVLGVSPWMSALQLYAHKVGSAPKADLAAENEAVEWGNALEGPVLARWERETKRKIITIPKPASVWAKDILDSTGQPFILATPDGIAEWPDGEMGVVEVKTTGGYNMADWQAGEPPVHYAVQIQQQMLVTGLQKGSFALLVDGRKFFYLDVARDDDFIQNALIPQLREFRERIIKRDPPEPVGKEGERQAVASIFPLETSGAQVSLGSDIQQLDEELEVLKGQAKEIDAEVEKRKAAIMLALGDAEVGVLPSGVRFTFKTTSRAGYTVEPKTFRELRRTEAKGGK